MFWLKNTKKETRVKKVKNFYIYNNLKAFYRFFVTLKILLFLKLCFKQRIALFDLFDYLILPFCFFMNHIFFFNVFILNFYVQNTGCLFYFRTLVFFFITCDKEVKSFFFQENPFFFGKSTGNKLMENFYIKFFVLARIFIDFFNEENFFKL